MKSSDPKSERRRFPRIPEAFSIKYRVSGELAASWCEVATQNVSAGGVRFRVPEPIGPGATVTLQIKLPGIAQPLHVKGQVAWSQLQASGVTEVGVEFLDLKERDQRMIDQLVGFLRGRV